MIDIHCHILPEVDDGAKSWEIAVEMCRLASADGIEHIVATPHANERYAYDREDLECALAELRRRVGATPTFSLGCDFHLSYENLKDVKLHPDRYSIGGTPYLLVELSDFSIPPRVDDSMLRLGDLGLTPVLTHPERNPILQQNLGRVVRLAEQGFVVQITASSLTGSWGERARRSARWLLESGAVHVLATDAHDSKHRIPNLSAGRDAAAEICGPEVAQALVDANPRAIIHGLPLPYFPAPVVKG